MRMKRLVVVLLVVFLSGTDADYVRLDVPHGFSPIPVPVHNPVTSTKVALGKRLFFDPILSRDSTIACSSCHLPEMAFTDRRSVSVGIEGRSGSRNAPSLVNIAYQKLFFWDGGSLTLEHQVFGPLEDANEMDADLAAVLERLEENTFYRELFERAFNESPGLRTLTQALASYQRTIRSGGSRYDRYMAGDTHALTVEEKRGKGLFEGRARCSRCHHGFLLSDHSFENNGLVIMNADSGRARITLQPEDYGRFKVPSLRNVERTAPYMHDGRIATLKAVIEHYNQGGMSVRGQHVAIRPLALTEAEKNDLVAFLTALNDDVIHAGLEEL